MNKKIFASVIACVAATAFALLNHAELWLCIVIFVLTPLIVYALMAFLGSKGKRAGRGGDASDNTKRKF